MVYLSLQFPLKRYQYNMTLNSVFSSNLSELGSKQENIEHGKTINIESYTDRLKIRFKNH